ncbi:hypothetical protein [Frankia sp. R82]|uniref:hypothetical protein n=1 Tax=Frankia sp. R82 TaxID=2950553 RepID=UPI002042D119|nr:hypothetical protein [Frankia sp. R82]MCM3886121.1 hypothetical protein [Frankia sp. R82]
MATTPTEDPLATLPDDLATRVQNDHAAYRQRTARLREALLVPGGYQIVGVKESLYGGLNYAPDGVPRLAAVDEWWELAADHAASLVTLAADHPDHGDVLRAQAGTVIAEVVRARNCALLALALAVVGPAGTRLRVDHDGAVMVAGTRIPLPPVAAAGPPPPSAIASLTISPGADPLEAASLLRRIAAGLEAGDQAAI